MNAFAIFLFGILGGLSRYEISTYLPKTGNFPLATLLINLLGCYLFAFLIKNYLKAINAHERFILALGTGFIGSFTTFSSFMLDADKLLILHDYLSLVIYLAISIFGGLAMIMLGMHHGRKLAKHD